MSRSVEEWIGKTDDQAIPPRVKLRVFDRCNGRCVTCTRKVGVGFEKPEYDHIVALVNSGEHREKNLQLLCDPCHKRKTAADVGEKAQVNKLRQRQAGIEPRKGRPMPGSKAHPMKHTINHGWVPRHPDRER